MVDVVVSLRVGRSEYIVGDRPCMVSSCRWSEHAVGSWVVVRGDSHLVDGKDSAQPLCLDLLKGPRSLSGCRGEGVECPKQAWLLLHGN